MDDYIYTLESKLLESFIHELKKNRNEENISKRAMRGNERKRPGWELAYGKRKRSNN
jgi:hypothetical protein